MSALTPALKKYYTNKRSEIVSKRANAQENNKSSDYKDLLEDFYTLVGASIADIQEISAAKDETIEVMNKAIEYKTLYEITEKALNELLNKLELYLSYKGLIEDFDNFEEKIEFFKPLIEKAGIKIDSLCPDNN